MRLILTSPFRHVNHFLVEILLLLNLVLSIWSLLLLSYALILVFLGTSYRGRVFVRRIENGFTIVRIKTVSELFI